MVYFPAATNTGPSKPVEAFTPPVSAPPLPQLPLPTPSTGIDLNKTVDGVTGLLNDVPAVVPCMPGAELEETLGENAWKAKLHVKLGPIALQFTVDVTREEMDESAGRVVLAAKAREAKGRGSADATIESTLAGQDRGTLGRQTIVGK